MSGWSVHLNTRFSKASLNTVNQFFVHILSLVTDNHHCSISGREEKSNLRNYFMINRRKSMETGQFQLTKGKNRIGLGL